MMPVIGDLISAGKDLIKSYFPPDMSPEERAKAEARLAELDRNARAQALEFQARMESELTERLKTDMSSDSWLSKNIRPLVLVYLMGAWTLFAGFSLYEQQVDAAYVEMLKQMLMAAFGFYFVSRGAEKITTILKGPPRDQRNR
ncbi:3TM-type holin [Marinobacter adhaerens]|uniref:3TM-type holin n=1 Tax=Marinobacter adhaerens TaxID=1033846 RepID=UPI003D2D8222